MTIVVVARLLRRLREVRRGLEDVGADVGLELAEVVAEHGDKLPGLYIIGRGIAPRVARIEDARIDARHRHRHAEMEMRVYAHLDMGERAVERGREQRPRRLDR